MDGTDPRSLAELVSALTSELASLVRKESELVRTEIAEKASQTGRAGVQLGIGAALLLGALGVVFGPRIRYSMHQDLFSVVSLLLGKMEENHGRSHRSSCMAESAGMG